VLLNLLWNVKFDAAANVELYVWLYVMHCSIGQA